MNTTRMKRIFLHRLTYFHHLLMRGGEDIKEERVQFFDNDSDSDDDGDGGNEEDGNMVMIRP